MGLTHKEARPGFQLGMGLTLRFEALSNSSIRDIKDWAARAAPESVKCETSAKYLADLGISELMSATGIWYCEPSSAISSLVRTSVSI